MKILSPSLVLAVWLSLVCGTPARVVLADTMVGVPPSRDSQATMGNYRDRPFSQWTFRNAGAPLNVVMIPREGDIQRLSEALRPELGEREFTDLHGRTLGLDELFEANFVDGVGIVQGSRLLHERYFHDFSPHSQHIWFSMTKSLASAAFGLLVGQGKVDLSASPAKYIPELKGSGFERVTIQQVLDHSTALDFKENYTDFQSDFFRYYAPALNMAWLPGAADAQPQTADIYGVHDFLARFVKPDLSQQPGRVFDYNSANADVLGWPIARISGEPFHEFIQRHIWSRLGTEHDAYIAVDRAYMPVATGDMNSTLRDALRFGMMIRDRGEYCAVGIHGQTIYINRSADLVMVWFSSQPGASAANNPDYHSKLIAARAVASSLTR